MDPRRPPSDASFISSSSPRRSFKGAVKIPSHVSTALKAKGLDVDNHGVVSWGTNSMSHPRQWPVLRKIYDTALICFLEFFMTLVSNTGSSVAVEVAADYDLARVTAICCFTTVYLLGQAFGGLILPPICESFGGRMIYFSSTLIFAIFSLIIGAWPKLPVVIMGRLITGTAAAMPAVVAAGSIENMWDLPARIWTIHVWISSAALGLALGPPTATYISMSSAGWRWIFYGSACIALTSALLCLSMRESRPSTVLRKHVRSVARETGFSQLSVANEHSLQNLKTFAKTTLINPIKLFFTESIVSLTSIMAASVYGVTYGLTEAFTVVYTNGFDFSPRHTSLVFLSIGVGVFLTFLPRLYDIHISTTRLKQNQPIEPEDKLFGFYLAAPILAIGLWIFASTVPPLVHITPWISIASLLLFGFAVVEFDNVLSGYLTDTYASYAASANASMAFLRAMLSSIFPLFGRQMFRKLGANNAAIVLASLATVYCGVAVMFGLYGKKIRHGSPFASKTWAESYN